MIVQSCVPKKIGLYNAPQATGAPQAERQPSSVPASKLRPRASKQQQVAPSTRASLGGNPPNSQAAPKPAATPQRPPAHHLQARRLPLRMRRRRTQHMLATARCEMLGASQSTAIGPPALSCLAVVSVSCSLLTTVLKMCFLIMHALAAHGVLHSPPLAPSCMVCLAPVCQMGTAAAAQVMFCMSACAVLKHSAHLLQAVL